MGDLAHWLRRFLLARRLPRNAAALVLRAAAAHLPADLADAARWVRAAADEVGP